MRRLRLLSGVLLLAGCDQLSDQKDDLRDARERWQDAGLDNYGYTLHYGCFCERSGAFQIVVHDDTVTSAVYIGEEEFPEWGEIPAMTVDEMFERIEDALDEDPEDADLEFDDELGYPTSVGFDLADNVDDDQWGFSVTDFAELTRND